MRGGCGVAGAAGGGGCDAVDAGVSWAGLQVRFLVSSPPLPLPFSRSRSLSLPPPSLSCSLFDSLFKLTARCCGDSHKFSILILW